MKLVILGASGRTGQYVAHQAIARGHALTDVVRRPVLAPDEAIGHAVAGDPSRADDLAQLLIAQDAIIFLHRTAFARRQSLLTGAARLALAAMACPDGPERGDAESHDDRGIASA